MQKEMGKDPQTDRKRDRQTDTERKALWEDDPRLWVFASVGAGQRGSARAPAQHHPRASAVPLHPVGSGLPQTCTPTVPRMGISPSSICHWLTDGLRTACS